LSGNDPFNLERFVAAQKDVYAEVVHELRNGRKRTHWMWFVFPQVSGLGRSPTSQFYAIKSEEEAHDYLGHPILGKRLKECASILLNGDESSAERIFGQPDTMKFRSSLTLFAGISEPGSVFEQALEKFFDGQSDPVTEAFLRKKH
jgi:uncharacterized protein (DUF1810 family)